MVRTLIALGANLDDRAQQLERAVELLRSVPEISGLSVSGWTETAPVGGPPDQGAFLNGAAAFETSLSAEQLLALLRRFEIALGRVPGERWAARTIDLDLLLYDSQVIHLPGLRVPHPRMAFRRFVLTVAAEVAADMRHPQLDRTVGELLAHLNTAAPYVAIAGLAGSGKSHLAEMLADNFHGELLFDPLANVASPKRADLPSLPSQVYQRQIEFLDRSTGWELTSPRNDTPLVVSDFYFDQCLAYADVELASGSASPATAENGYAQFRAAWSARTMTTPKLLVMLDAPPPVRTENNVESARLQAALIRVVTRPGAGPVLFVPGNGRNDAIEKIAFPEVCAAIEAMR